MSASDHAASTNALARRNRRCLVALPFALALTGWLALADAWRDYRAVNAAAIVDAAPDAHASHAGSDWQLTAFERAPAPTRQPLPSGVSRVRIEIAVTPGDAAAIATLGACVVELVAADGRRWSATGGDLFAPGALPERCDGDYKRKLAVGQTMRFEQFFTVPAADVDAVEPLVAIGRRNPALLRLRRH